VELEENIHFDMADDRKVNNNKGKVHTIPHQQLYQYFPMTVIGDFCKILVRPLFLEPFAPHQATYI
jgi:hypothetical protein